MNIKAWYSLNYETRLTGRYITLEHINPLLKGYENSFDISTVGVSELGKDISLIKIGSGEQIVLAWSQMHGNETTTTRSVFDFLKFLCQKEAFQDEIRDFQNKYTIYIIPILNPDGASLYTRENSNFVDLNRDAQDLSQKESMILRAVYERVKPQLCLNLHDQRSIFGLKNDLPAIVSFLSPASDMERTITSSRKIAMVHIVRMNTMLQNFIPDRVGRYGDSYNNACIGDTFQGEGVPTILFEAGHSGKDYLRNKTRAYIFYSLYSLFGFSDTDATKVNYKDYFLIPENIKNYKDFIVRNVLINESDQPTSIAIQYSEKLVNGKILFIPKLVGIGEIKDFKGHIEIDAKNASVLVNSQNNIKVGDEISTIVNKNDSSLIYFDKNDLSF